MKHFIYLIFVSVFITSCSSSKNFVTLHGKITGNQTKKIKLKNSKLKFDRTLKIKPDGTFKDTLKLNAPAYFILTDGDQKSLLHLKNGDKIKIKLDAEKFTESISLSGKGAMNSSYLAKKALLEKQFFNNFDFERSKKDFKSKLSKHSTVLSNELKATNDSLLIKKQKKYLKSFEKSALRTYEFENYLALNLPEGTEAPDFSYSYEDPNKKEYLLEDFRGKYLYIKFWATWCMQCRKEAPYFKKLAKKYSNKNIQFLSVSIDQKRAFKLWKRKASKTSNNIVELYSDEDEDFKEIYKLQQIPRFILIDPEGAIIDANAPVPSSEKINTLLDKL